jgi:hypothetical protein
VGRHPLEPPVRCTCVEVAAIVAAGLGWALRLRLTRTAVFFASVLPPLLPGLPLTFLVGLHHGARAVMCEEVEKLAVAGAVTFP